jgi:threonylcarbamoyladenosine tRNA methylthiotransferase MtaB
MGYLPLSPLSHLHVFPYSDRPGTAAGAIGDKVPGGVIRERAAALRAIGSTLARHFRERHVGSIRPGLTIDDGATVVTDNYLKMRIPPGLGRNRRVEVKIGSEGGVVVGAPKS